jgi:hypothetical protein
MNRLNQTEPATFSILTCSAFFRDSYFLYFMSEYYNVFRGERVILGGSKLHIKANATPVIKATFNKFHKNKNSDISLTNLVSYRLQILLLCQDNQNEFYKHKKGATSLWRN